MIATVIVFFHAIITVGNESIFLQVKKYTHIVSCNLNFRQLTDEKFLTSIKN